MENVIPRNLPHCRWSSPHLPQSCLVLIRVSQFWCSMGRRRHQQLQFKPKTPNLFLCELSGTASDPLHIVSNVNKILTLRLGAPELTIIQINRFQPRGALLTFWVLLTRLLFRFLSVLSKRTELFLHCCVLLFWTLSLVGRQSPDYGDGKQPSRTPWYLTHSCNVARQKSRVACRVSQTSFGITIVLL